MTDLDAELRRIAQQAAPVLGWPTDRVEDALRSTFNAYEEPDPDWVREIMDGPSTSERWTVPDPQEPPA